jgi:hypothetical protein
LFENEAAIDAEGPDWWKRLSPNGGKPKSAKEGKTGNGKGKNKTKD